MTNDLQRARIEAAAKAMWDLRKAGNEPVWDMLERGVRNEYRKDARAALVAAAALGLTAEQEGETVE